MQRLTILLVAVVFSFTLAACDTDIDDDTLKVGLIVSAAGANDNGYNESAIDGLEEMESEHDLQTQVVTSADDVPGSLAELAEEGFDLVFSLEYDFDALIHDDGSGESIAEQYPDTTFVTFNDYANTDEDGDKIHDNVIEVLFNINEASFLAGAASALVNEHHDELFTSDDYDFTPTSENRAMGFVGGTESNGILVFSYGFAEGINYIAEDYDVNYELYETYSAGFESSQENYNTIESYYDSGANVVFTSAGGVNVNMQNAADENGKLGIEVDANNDDQAPGYILTSVLKTTSVPVKDLVQELIDGEMEGGREIFYDLDSGATGITNMEVIEDYIADSNEAQDRWDEIESTLEDISQDIDDGTIDVTDAQKGEELDYDDLPNLEKAN